jgi:hypothetical protein
MAKYDVVATVTVETTIEPDGQIEEPYIEGLDEFVAEGFGGAHDIEDRCEIRFVYETETAEDEVEDEIQQALDGTLDYTGDDIGWEVTDVTIDSVEKQQMEVGEAVGIIRSFIDSRDPVFTEVHGNVREALELLLQQF